MAQTKKIDSQIIVFLANRRTGSNYLMKVLNNFPEIEFFGEVFHWDTVWMPSDRKQQYVIWLKNTRGIDISIGEQPFEDKELVKLNHSHPDYLLDFIASTSPKRYVGFKIFPEHLKWYKLKTHILANKKIKKVILKRNLLDVYISDRILEMTNKSQRQDTSNIKVNINCLDFKAWYYNTMSFYSRVELYLHNSNQKYSELSYEELHSHNSNDEKVDFLQSWLLQNGIEIEARPKIANYTKKQDKRKNSLAKVENDREFKNCLQDNNLQHLVHSEV